MLELMPITQVFSKSMIRLGELNQEPQILDEDWRNEVIAQMVIIKLCHQQVSELTPPPELKAMHNQLLSGTTDIDKAMDVYAEGLDSLDAQKITQAVQLMQSGNSKINKATALLNQYLGQ